MSVPAAEARRIVAAALDEDLGRGGDITTLSVFPGGRAVEGALVAREGGVLAGLPLTGLVLEEMAARTGHAARWEPRLDEGARFEAGAVLARVSGDARNVLTAERVLLNLLARLCGIATLTRRAVDEIAGLDCTIADTRKTTPGLRTLEKYAVRAGGGENHRATLDALVMVKDNHKTLAGGLPAALEALAAAGHTMRDVEIEVDAVSELGPVIEAGCGWVLLDNMTPAEVREAVRIIRGRCRVEVSGGLAPGGLRPYAEAGADRLSLGVLTHGARAIDLSLDVTAAPPARGP